MAGTAYVDSSALLKLVVREAETSALESFFLQCDGLVASRLAELECRRAAHRASNARVRQRMDDVLESVYLLDITRAILDDAAEATPILLRSLDAIHLATALSIGEPQLQLVTYDDRLADAARAHGLSVVQPGKQRLTP